MTVAGRIVRWIVVMLVIAAYVGVDLMLRPLAGTTSQYLPFYLGAGLAFALLLVAGERWFPVLFVARLIILALASRGQFSLAWTVASATVHTMVYALGAAVVSRRVVVTRPIWRVQDVTWLLGGMYVSAAVQALACVWLLNMRGRLPSDVFWQFVSNFAAGDAAGMLVVVPFALFVVRPLLRRERGGAEEIDSYVGSPDSPVSLLAGQRPRVELIGQATALFAALVLVGTTVGRGIVIPGGALIILFLPLAWISVRDGLMGSAIAIFAYGVGTLLFSRYTPAPLLNVRALQSDLLILSFAGLLLAAARSASHESAARYWQLVATAAEGIWRLDSTGNTVSVSSRMAAMLGRREEEIVGHHAAEFIAPEDLPYWNAQRRDRGAGRASAYELRLVHADGSRVSVLVNASPVRSVTTGEQVGAVALVTDVTAMRQAERQQRHAQLLLETAFHSSQDAMALYRSSDQVLIEVNAVWSAVTAYSREAAIGRPLNELGIWGDPADAARVEELVREHGFTRDFEITFNRRGSVGGTERGHALLSAYPIQLDDERYMLVTARDISVERRAADAQRQVTRMEELGRLAGGVAHDFNNLLTVIGVYAQMARSSIEGGEAVSLSDVDEIKAAADRGHELTRRLLAFSRHQPTEVRVVQLEPLLRRADGMLRSLLPSGIQLRMEFGEAVPAIMADETQIDQVLLNLVVNARDAMPSGGELVLRTSALRVREGEAATLVGPDTLPGEYVVLTATDTGVGMDAATQARAFEPFFTTKAPGEGTGLGLAVIYGIVRQARGAVRVNSASGRGTTFTIFWPAAPFASVPSPRGRITPSGTPRGGGHVLLIEDDAVVRRMTRRVLADAGFEVSTAEDGARGLACLKQLQHDGRPPDVVLSDISMPVLNGREVAARLLVSDPLLPVVLVSGYDEMREDAPALPNVPFPVLMKPYEVAELITLVCAAIAQRATQ